VQAPLLGEEDIEGDTGDWGTPQKKGTKSGFGGGGSDGSSSEDSLESEDSEDENIDTVNLFIKHHRAPTGMTGNKRMDNRLRLSMEQAHSITIKVGTLGIAISRSSDPKYAMQVDYLTGNGDVEQLRASGVAPLMVIARVNGRDMDGLSYDEVRQQIKPRPCTIVFEGAAGGVDFDKEWADEEKEWQNFRYSLQDALEDDFGPPYLEPTRRSLPTVSNGQTPSGHQRGKSTNNLASVTSLATPPSTPPPLSASSRKQIEEEDDETKEVTSAAILPNAAPSTQKKKKKGKKSKNKNKKTLTDLIKEVREDDDDDDDVDDEDAEDLGPPASYEKSHGTGTPILIITQHSSDCGVDKPQLQLALDSAVRALNSSDFAVLKLHEHAMRNEAQLTKALAMVPGLAIPRAQRRRRKGPFICALITVDTCTLNQNSQNGIEGDGDGGGKIGLLARRGDEAGLLENLIVLLGQKFTPRQIALVGTNHKGTMREKSLAGTPRASYPDSFMQTLSQEDLEQLRPYCEPQQPRLFVWCVEKLHLLLLLLLLFLLLLLLRQSLTAAHLPSILVPRRM
jgi:hypothetical protein